MGNFKNTNFTIINCDYCSNPAAKVTGKEIYPHRPDLFNLIFWSCVPCDAWVGCHKNSNGVPLGRLANAELRKWKSKAHQAFDPLWKFNGKNRNECYQWLAKKMNIPVNKCHIGMFTVDQCKMVVDICKTENIR